MNKDTTFSIRIASEDLAAIKQNAKQARMSQGEYVTRCCLGRQIVVMDGLKEVLQQQRAIGNNLNRLTVLANMGRITAVDLERTARELADISAASEEAAAALKTAERRLGEMAVLIKSLSVNS